jgi:phenylalanyl-tRNA synthetase beta chain
LRNNLRQRDRVLLFELARTWHGQLPPEPGSLPDERRHVGIAMCGPRADLHWSGSSAELDFFDLKGVVDALCTAFHASVSYAPARHASFHPGRTASISVRDQQLGILGQLHPALAEKLDLEGKNVLLAELDFEVLLQVRQPLLSVATPSRYPPADRDIALIVSEQVNHADVEAAIREAAQPLLESVSLFDIYRGESIPTGRKSLAYALRYRAPDRTLSEDEVVTTHGRVEEAVRTRFQGEVRGR